MRLRSSEPSPPSATGTSTSTTSCTTRISARFVASAARCPEMIDVSDPAFEARARAVKAFRIARVLYDVEAVDTLRWLDANQMQRDRVATVAKVNPPSEQTWRIAVALLGDMRNADRRARIEAVADEDAAVWLRHLKNET